MLEIVRREAFGTSFAVAESVGRIFWVRERKPPPAWVSADALL